MKGVFNGLASFTSLPRIDLLLHLLVQVMQKAFQMNEPDSSRCSFTTQNDRVHWSPYSENEFI